MVAMVVREVQACGARGEVANDPHWLARLVHIDVGAQKERQCLQL